MFFIRTALYLLRIVRLRVIRPLVHFPFYVYAIRRRRRRAEHKHFVFRTRALLSRKSAVSLLLSNSEHTKAVVHYIFPTSALILSLQHVAAANPVSAPLNDQKSPRHPRHRYLFVVCPFCVANRRRTRARRFCWPASRRSRRR